jgi:hypothetical protein
MSENKLDWPQELLRREAPVPNPAIPTECPACNSQRIFIGSGNLKCFHCNRVIKLERSSTTMSDVGASAANIAIEEQQENLKDFRKNRGL